MKDAHEEHNRTCPDARKYRSTMCRDKCDCALNGHPFHPYGAYQQTGLAIMFGAPVVKFQLEDTKRVFRDNLAIGPLEGKLLLWPLIVDANSVGHPKDVDAICECPLSIGMKPKQIETGETITI